MVGVIGRSGSKKIPKTQLKEALEDLTGDIPDLINKLKEIAMGNPITCPHCGKEIPQTKPDIEACKYLIDRILGKPKNVSELHVDGQIDLIPVHIRDNAQHLIELQSKASQEQLEGITPDPAILLDSGDYKEVA